MSYSSTRAKRSRLSRIRLSDRASCSTRSTIMAKPRASFSDALKINPNSTRALVGLAQSKQFESNESQLVLINKALKTNQNRVPALVPRHNRGGIRQPRGATQQIDRAFKINQMRWMRSRCARRCSI